MVKRIETAEAKVKLTVLIPQSVREAIRQEAEAADESQSLFICNLLELYRSAAEPIATVPADIPQPAAPPPAPAPSVPRVGAMKQMEQSLEGGFGGQSEATRMLEARLRKERGASIERIHRQSEAAGKSEE